MFLSGRRGYDGNLQVADPATVPQVGSVGNHSVAERSRTGVEVHEQTIEAAPADVWGFMVDPAALSAWFGADAWLEPVVGGSVLFRFADGSVRRGVVEQVERSHMLTWRWREHRGAGFGMELGESSRVTIELEAVETGTLVRITDSQQATAAAS